VIGGTRDHGICHHERGRCGRHHVGATISETVGSPQ
jgi:hypothetical protein